MRASFPTRSKGQHHPPTCPHTNRHTSYLHSIPPLSLLCILLSHILRYTSIIAHSPSYLRIRVGVLHPGSRHVDDNAARIPQPHLKQGSTAVHVGRSAVCTARWPWPSHPHARERPAPASGTRSLHQRGVTARNRMTFIPTLQMLALGSTTLPALSH